MEPSWQLRQSLGAGVLGPLLPPRRAEPPCQQAGGLVPAARSSPRIAGTEVGDEEAWDRVTEAKPTSRQTSQDPTTRKICNNIWSEIGTVTAEGILCYLNHRRILTAFCRYIGKLGRNRYSFFVELYKLPEAAEEDNSVIIHKSMRPGEFYRQTLPNSRD